MPTQTYLLLTLVLSPLLAAGTASAQSAFDAPSGPVVELPEMLVEGEAARPSAMHSSAVLPAPTRAELSEIPLRDNFRRQLLASATTL